MTRYEKSTSSNSHYYGIKVKLEWKNRACSKYYLNIKHRQE